MSFSVDYWDIEIDDLIGEIPYDDLLFNCMSQADRSTAPSCAFFLNGDGHDGIFPDDATATLANLGIVTTDGIDINTSWNRTVNWGWASGISFDTQITMLNSYQEQFPITGIRDREGTIRNERVYPELKLNTFLTFEADDWSFTWGTRYISSMDDYLRPANLTDDAVAESIWYQDIFVNLDFFDSFDIVIGLDNVTDEDPPRFHSSFNAETEPGYYDVIGRRAFLNVSYTF